MQQALKQEEYLNSAPIRRIEIKNNTCGDAIASGFFGLVNDPIRGDVPKKNESPRILRKTGAISAWQLTSVQRQRWFHAICFDTSIRKLSITQKISS